MSLRVVVQSPAETDLLESALFIAEDDPAAAQRFLDHAEKALARLAESADDRRAAAALLGWFRDTRSIEPIVTALEAAPGALTREQLLFDLNMILLTEARPVVSDDRDALATLHLQWLYGQLVNEPIDSDIRATLLTQKIIHVLPDRITASFSATLGTTRAILARSPEAFLDAVRKTGCGVAFHAITAANGVARVATTLYLPKGRIANQVWISLYRRDGDGWTPLPVPSHPVLHRFVNEPSLMPTINRNYGPDHPLKILRLDLTMERIRVDLKARECLHSENRESPVGQAGLDASYVRLLERYKRSDSPRVKYTAEYESSLLTKRPNLELWIDALSQQSGTPIQGLAVQVLAHYVAPRFKDRGPSARGHGTRGARRRRPEARSCRPESLTHAAAKSGERQERAAMEPLRTGRSRLRLWTTRSERLFDAVRAPRESLAVFMRGIDLDLLIFASLGCGPAPLFGVGRPAFPASFPSCRGGGPRCNVWR
jgi:hypothetical protein